MQALTVQAAGLGELVVSQDPDDVLTAQGLGSCIGIAAYDPVRKVAALAHVMLPGPVPSGGGSPDQPARFAPQAVDAMIAAIEERGGQASRLVIKLAGGAQVIRLAGGEDRLKIGARNIAAVEEALAQRGLRINAKDVGGNAGRTMSLYVSTGQTTVRVVGSKEQPL